MSQSKALTLYHNARCSKSRAALQLLTTREIDVVVVDYLATPPDAKTLQRILAGSDLPPLAFVRTGDAAFAESGGRLAENAGIDEVARFLAEHPGLLQRPVLVAGERSVIGRPPELVLELIERS